jgi:glycosyltransferase involved in cell wall biosynthesis
MTLADRTVSLYAAGAQNWTHFDRGIPRYVVEHVRALHRLAPQSLQSVLLNPRHPLVGSFNWLLGTGLLGFNGAERSTAGQRAVPRQSVYHIMSPFELDTPLDNLWPAWARGSGVSTVVTVYDLIPLIFSDHYLADPRVRLEYEARVELIRHVDGVLAISQSTADDVVERLGVRRDRVHVIHAGATETFATMYASREQAGEHVARHIAGITRGFFLYVGGFEFRKNLEGLIAGYARLAPELRRTHQLVIACRMLPEQRLMLERLGGRLGIRPGELVLTGYVSDADLGALYHACTLFVFPSLYEGSGLPILEAMSCGAPVAASATSTGPEILGGPEATFDPRSPDSIASCLTEVMTSTTALRRLADRSRERIAQYSWRRVAEESIDAYDRVLARASRRRPMRPRIALVTPWPPERSGIADYSLRLARQLGLRADVDVIVDRPVQEYAEPLEEGVHLFSARDFDWVRTARQPDRIVYCMGNSAFHGFVHHLLRRHPGAVVLHDTRLTGFYGWLAGTERPEDPVGRLAEWIRALYGDRLPPQATEAGPPTWEAQLALGIYMTREVQQYAQRCFVHSEFARDILALDRAPSDRDVPVAVLPFGMPDVDRSPRDPEPAKRPLIISLGYVHEVKGLATLIRAFALLATEMPAARLVIAGPTDAAESERWHRYKQEHAPRANIEIPGAVSAERYAELLRTADLAVQLRQISNGEASAAVADCLSAGVPTVVTDVGWTSELPATAVSKVPLDVGPEQLKSRMAELLASSSRRQAIGSAAQACAAAATFADVADAYLDALGLR